MSRDHTLHETYDNRDAINNGGVKAATLDGMGPEDRRKYLFAAKYNIAPYHLAGLFPEVREEVQRLYERQRATPRRVIAFMRQWLATYDDNQMDKSPAGRERIMREQEKAIRAAFRGLRAKYELFRRQRP